MKRTLLGAALLLLVAPSAHADDKADAIVVARSAFDAIVKEDFEGAAKTFGGQLKKDLPADKLKDTWKEVIGKVGAFKKVHSTTVKFMGDKMLVTLSCEFEKFALDVHLMVEEKNVVGLTLDPSVTLLYKPPDYVKPDAFREEEVKINPGEWELPGTLTLPKGNGPFPAVVLVHGSGPHDRDEAIGPNLPFRDLAWGLATKGIAVLRYEKRTTEHAYKVVKQNIAVTIKDEVTDDALAAVALLRKRKDIDPKQIYVLGHSLGGYLAPQIGKEDPKLAGLILLAGNSRPLTDLVVEQTDYLMTLPDTTNAQKEELGKMKNEVAKIKDPKLGEGMLKSEQIMGAPVAYWLSLRDYDAPATAAKLKLPMLVLWGERDYQITSKDFEGWKGALKGHDNVRFKSYPKLNHLFMEGEGKSQPKEYGVPGHVSSAVLDDIAEWIKKR